MTEKEFEHANKRRLNKVFKELRNDAKKFSLEVVITKKMIEQWAESQSEEEARVFFMTKILHVLKKTPEDTDSESIMKMFEENEKEEFDDSALGRMVLNARIKILQD
jgi:hypothetical protein